MSPEDISKGYNAHQEIADVLRYSLICVCLATGTHARISVSLYRKVVYSAIQSSLCTSNNRPVSSSIMRWWKSICHCPSFFLFFHSEYLLQSVLYCTKAGGLVIMRGIFYTKPINILFASPLIFLLSPPTRRGFPRYPRCTSQKLFRSLCGLDRLQRVVFTPRAAFPTPRLT